MEIILRIILMKCIIPIKSTHKIENYPTHKSVMGKYYVYVYIIIYIRI